MASWRVPGWEDGRVEETRAGRPLAAHPGGSGGVAGDLSRCARAQSHLARASGATSDAGRVPLRCLRLRPPGSRAKAASSCHSPLVASPPAPAGSCARLLHRARVPSASSPRPSQPQVTSSPPASCCTNSRVNPSWLRPAPPCNRTPTATSSQISRPTPAGATRAKAAHSTQATTRSTATTTTRSSDSSRSSQDRFPLSTRRRGSQLRSRTRTRRASSVQEGGRARQPTTRLRPERRGTGGRRCSAACRRNSARCSEGRCSERYVARSRRRACAAG